MPGEIGDMWWVLLLLGLGAGVLSGTLGLGSGTLLIPILTLLFLFPQKSAQGTALMVMVPMAALSAYLYWRDPTIHVNPKVALIIIPTALVGAVIGWKLATHVPGHLLKKVFAVYLIIVAAKILIFTPWSKQTLEQTPPETNEVTLVEKGEVSDG